MLVPEHPLSEMASSLLCLKFKKSLYTVAFLRHEIPREARGFLGGHNLSVEPGRTCTEEVSVLRPGCAMVGPRHRGLEQPLWLLRGQKHGKKEGRP